MARSTVVLMLGLGFVTSALGGGHPAAQGLAPAITLNGQTTTLAMPVGLLDPATQHVSVLFPVKPLPSAIEAAARLANAWDLSKTGPAVLVDFDFTPGSSSGLADAMKSCRITATGFASPLKLGGGARECHVVSVGGMIRPGGLFIGLIQGQTPAYTLYLPFTTAFYDLSAASGAKSPAAAGAPAEPALPAIPPNTATGSGTYTGQTITFTHGLAWWDATQRMTKVMFFDHAPKPGVIDDARKGIFGDDAPLMDVYIRFTDGAAPSLASVDYCFVNLTFPKGGPMGINTTTKGCGFLSLYAEPRAGGTVNATMKGQARGPVADYTWDVRFNLPIAK